MGAVRVGNLDQIGFSALRVDGKDSDAAVGGVIDRPSLI
jgi:hypothetical protein